LSDPILRVTSLPDQTKVSELVALPQPKSLHDLSCSRITSYGSKAFNTAPVICADANIGRHFKRMHPGQKIDIQSHMSLPILKSNLEKSNDSELPKPLSARPWGEALGALCIDSRKRDAFAGFTHAGGDAIVSELQPFLADVQLGLLLRKMTGHTPFSHYRPRKKRH
jgi:hypothetical protein